MWESESVGGFCNDTHSDIQDGSHSDDVQEDGLFFQAVDRVKVEPLLDDMCVVILCVVLRASHYFLLCFLFFFNF